jgi:hypothetical protein
VCDLGGLRSRGAPRAGRRTAESRFATVRARVCVARGDRAAGLGGFGRPPPPPPALSVCFVACLGEVEEGPRVSGGVLSAHSRGLDEAEASGCWQVPRWPG